MTIYHNNMRKIYLACFCFLFFLQAASAQQNNTKLFSVNFQQATISQVVNELESKSSYHFYYDAMQFDSLRVTLQVTDKPLTAILDLAFQKTAFTYAVNNQQVFLTKGRQIKTELAPGYSIAAASKQVAPQTAPVADYTAEAEKKVPDATTENK